MSALHVSRRTAFGLAGAASATVALAACSGGVNGVSSPSERTDFSGEIKFDSFDTSAGEYKPATKDHPAENGRCTARRGSVQGSGRSRRSRITLTRSQRQVFTRLSVTFLHPCSTSSSLLTPNP